MGEGIRTCTKCDTAKPLSEFHRDAKSPGGLRRQCKTCRCSQTLEWWYSHQERQLARHRDYVDENRERVREIDTQRYERDRDNRIDLATSVGHARRARAQGGDYDFKVTRAAIRQRDGDACHYCGRTMDFARTQRTITAEKATIEHVVPISAAGGHTFENVVLACWGCNSEKRNGDADAFRERLDRRSTSDPSGLA